ncbi:transmembrane protein, putative (macronuclear) [Tetrahymena thermophila SB210]|uniref:Transmembrane protein, putative n=1 Tax=Tetrahymena thermophila (strain SB210) TaxID=312017 RepID=W7X623_TETTS|nr:transmembrane protein, putative [Tetrahymena thermophila SB210]EWS74805.1 transmembrane protein, putative [Tetrahymena thermophila SB210]|eukprot:XP_012652698.1 transmembrane protein, putative [Tetrahymena thermophila SB210]
MLIYFKIILKKLIIFFLLILTKQNLASQIKLFKSLNEYIINFIVFLLNVIIFYLKVQFRFLFTFQIFFRIQLNQKHFIHIYSLLKERRVVLVLKILWNILFYVYRLFFFKINIVYQIYFVKLLVLVFLIE